MLGAFLSLTIVFIVTGLRTTVAIAIAWLIGIAAYFYKKDQLRDHNTPDFLGRPTLSAPFRTLAYVGPISIHAIVAELIGFGEDFGNWIGASVVLVGYC